MLDLNDIQTKNALPCSSLWKKSDCFDFIPLNCTVVGIELKLDSE